MAGSFNLPMLSYFCQHFETSDKTLYPTFLRTRPPATFISKSLTSLLLEYNWKQATLFKMVLIKLDSFLKVAFIHPASEDDIETRMVANTVVKTLAENRIKVHKM